jgi:type VI secretion system secreted protein Hcp
MSGEKIYMTFGDVKGEVAETNHKNWVEIDTCEFTVTRNAMQETGNPKRNIGSPTMSKILVTKSMDNSTPSIFLEAIAGNGQNCTIHYLKGGNNLNVFMEYKLENAIISKYVQKKIKHISGAQEQLEISFTVIKTVYTPYDAAGKRGTPMTSGYDIVGAKRI